MPKIRTHLNLALKLNKKINISDIDSFLLGNAYPDCWKTSVDQSLLLHYKKEATSCCDLEEFIKNEEKNDFNFGYYFHLWVDNHIENVDLQHIRKYDVLICDMDEIRSTINELQELHLCGKKQQALDNILAQDPEPMPLYIVPDEIKNQYDELLNQIVEDFMNHLSMIQWSK